MEPLRLKPRQPVEEAVENWDDDDFMIDNDNLTFPTNSTTNPRVQHRDSQSSFRSDRESLPGNEERQVHLPGDDEKSTLDAIAAATHAGIPIPKNVPTSALMGGTIKRLGGRKIKKIFQEDWGDDLELPATGQALRLKPKEDGNFPEVLRQVSGSTNPSPVKKSSPSGRKSPSPVGGVASPRKPLLPKNLAAPINLEKFKDTDDDEDMFGDGAATIKPSKLRPQSRPMSLITPPTPSPQKKRGQDDFEDDLELPSDGKLTLTRRKDIPKTPSLNTNDDFEWAEGSLGTRFGGTKRDAFSTRSSTTSALSPSIASSITAESEDEIFDGLLIPNGPLDLGKRLQQRRQSRSPDRTGSDKQAQPSKNMVQIAKEQEDPFSGLDFGNGDVFHSRKPSLHRNVKVKETRPASPTRPKTAVSITFTNKPVTSPPSSRLPKPKAGHERTHTQSSLEPVSESGGPIPPKPSRRAQSRLGHTNQPSISSVHSPAVSSFQFGQPATPRRRELGQKASTGALRNEPTTTSAQLLRMKRSLPVMSSAPSPVKPAFARADRPPSRTASRADSIRPLSALRPKTPPERAQTRKNQTPFLPAGASQTQSQHISAKVPRISPKSSRVFRRHGSDQGPETGSLSRANSRFTNRSPSPKSPRSPRRPSPRRARNEKIAAEPVWQQVNKPRRLRRFGDGHELDAFDDLPTSAQAESKFVKQPVGSGNRTNIRNKMYQNVLPDRKTPSPVSPYSPARMEHLPRFARDTAASRNAREANLAMRAPPSAPLAPLTVQRVAQLSTRTNLNPHHLHSSARPKKARKQPPQLKPHLISNLNSAKESKVINGMTYNPATFRWEGNENVLNAFDVPASSPSTTSVPPCMREKESSTPRPVLITNMSVTKGVKRVGDMVFDPQNMCWLKVDTSAPLPLRPDDPMAGVNTVEDDDDPFKDIPDLDDRDKESVPGGLGRVSDIREDWLVGEEFDVGPEFIRRQREEESRWRRKCEKWTGTGERDQTSWRWAIRNMIMDR
ncbi:hypothetical protein F4779DRAFT_60597 [Xylariaceae sp. FL0662B]|nr:hypothetical protein F4779DRAFT_60597 [Xylariaceae sp. FL0662B]